LEGPTFHDAPRSIEMDYRLVTQTPRVVAVQGSGINWSSTTHPVFLQETLVFLPDRQQWLTAPMLIGKPEGWQAVGDYVCADLHRQASTEYAEDTRNGEDLTSCILLGAVWAEAQGESWQPDADTFSDFLPQINENGLIFALRFVFSAYSVSGPFPRHPWEVDVPASVLYPYLAEEYRDWFVAP